jgi:hypothetical protein
MELPKFEATFAALFTAPVMDLLTLLNVLFAAFPIEFSAEVVALLIELRVEFVVAPRDFILLLLGLPIEPILGDFGAVFMTSN